jgi:uncharacterized protein (DUF2252 family)
MHLKEAPRERRTRLAGPPSDQLADRLQAGKALRKRVPRGAHEEWAPPADRPDPISLLEEQAKDRVPDLVPVRYGRMRTSPFAFLRGSAIVMAEDLSRTPTTGVTVQACGDAHMLNFGVFATPERNVVFDLNDFDETLPGPWEWDLKRLAASLVVAGRQRGFSGDQNHQAVAAMTRAYARWMREFAAMRYIDVWYSRLDVDMILAALSGKQRARAKAGIEKARLRDHLQAQAKLTEVVDGRRRIVDNPPLVVRLPEDTFESEIIRGALEDYLKTLQPDRRALLSRYRMIDAAAKVVGVGSVGTRCYIALLTGAHEADPLFLQVKEAAPSVLERYLPRSRFLNNGKRVVEGQRMIQAASDAFLGWIRGRGSERRDFYWRQLRDVKGSVDPEAIEPRGLLRYAEACGATLARACARSGDAAAISGYIGTGTKFPDAIARFAEAYADQTERDHAALVQAIRTGRLEARESI